MKIVAINAVGLVGETPKGGWTVENLGPGVNTSGDQ